MTDILEREAPADDIVVECDLEAAPEKVWRALTTPELVSTWLDVPATDDADRDLSGPAYRLIEALPFSRVRYAWSDPAASEPETFVTFDLVAQPSGGTWFRLTHSAEATASRRSLPANTNRPPMARAA
ncbi:SRPBCC family protein [Aminobacter sp. HY435]|uniref:SRPBCC family protein n=1 Tax=Aminobacter sp. HY435 TaxID=2970917 RepID=UPI0022B9460B|nr:SRPBCC domain-containing protein [Aminobacter sp. HY435]